jgi:hypothetical protein
MDYDVSALRNDVVDYRRVIRLTTITGGKVFLAFPDDPPADWLQLTASGVNVFLPATEFEPTYQVLLHESPVFVTALNLVGLRAFSLDSGDEAPGQGLADPDPLRELVERTAAATPSDRAS